MARTSTKANKNIYHKSREECGLTRAQASEEMGFISESQIERIEYGKAQPHPEDVLAMAKAYKKAGLCNYYCSNECPIGQQYVPAIEIQDGDSREALLPSIQRKGRPFFTPNSPPSPP